MALSHCRYSIRMNFSHNHSSVHYSALPVLVILTDQIQFMVNKVSENFLKFTVIEGLILSCL